MFEKVDWREYLLSIIFRFAKRKLDDFVFFGNKLQVSYAPQFESLSDTMDKLEGRRREVLARLNRKLKPDSGYTNACYINYCCNDIFINLYLPCDIS